MSNNLDLDQVAAGQNQKEVTINDSNGQLDAAVTDTQTLLIDNTNALTLTNDQFRRFQFTSLGPDTPAPTAAITVTVPAIKRGTFTIINDTGFTVTVTITGQSETAPTVINGARALLSCDGTNVRAVDVSGGTPVTIPQPNLFGNPAVAVNQQGTAGFTGLSSNTYIHDRWRLFATTSGSVDVSTSVVSPGQDSGGKAPITALRIDVNTIDASIDPNDVLAVATGVIDTDVASFFDSQVIISFRVRANQTGTYTLSVQNSALDASYLANFTINAINTWEPKTVVLTLDTTQGSAWPNGTTRGLGVRVSIALAAGSNLQGTNNSWNAGIVLGTASTNNFLSSASNWIEFTAFKFEPGSSKTAYIDESWSILYELALDYYFQSYNYGVSPGTITAVGRYDWRQTSTVAAPNLILTDFFPTKLRAVPAIVLYSDVTGAVNNIRDLTAAADIAVTGIDASEWGHGRIGLGAAVATGNRVNYHVTARSEII